MAAPPNRAERLQAVHGVRVEDIPARRRFGVLLHRDRVERTTPDGRPYFRSIWKAVTSAPDFVEFPDFVPNLYRGEILPP